MGKAENALFSVLVWMLEQHIACYDLTERTSLVQRVSLHIRRIIYYMITAVIARQLALMAIFFCPGHSTDKI